MHSYAQNNGQLWNQLREAGYSQADLEQIARAYRLALKLFTCRFQPSGKTFIAHLVGAASILAKLRAPAHLVAAGLLHNAYQNGDFGDGSQGLKKFKSEVLVKVVGCETEAVVAGFYSLTWNTKSLLAIRDGLAQGGRDSLSSTKRDVVLLRLADQLEHELDLDVLYFQAPVYASRVEEMGDVLVEIASGLGFPELGHEIKQAGEAAVVATVPEELKNPARISFAVIPRSFRLRWNALLYQRLRALRERIRRKNTGSSATHQRLP